MMRKSQFTTLCPPPRNQSPGVTSWISTTKTDSTCLRSAPSGTTASPSTNTDSCTCSARSSFTLCLRCWSTGFSCSSEDRHSEFQLEDQKAKIILTRYILGCWKCTRRSSASPTWSHTSARSSGISATKTFKRCGRDWTRRTRKSLISAWRAWTGRVISKRTFWESDSTWLRMTLALCLPLEDAGSGKNSTPGIFNSQSEQHQTKILIWLLFQIYDSAQMRSRCFPLRRAEDGVVRCQFGILLIYSDLIKYFRCLLVCLCVYIELCFSFV